MERLGRSGVRTGVQHWIGPLGAHSSARHQARARYGSALLVILAGLIAVLGSGSDVRAVSQASVEIQESKYLPPTLTIPEGTTVKWANRDEETHTVTSATGLFGSAGLDLGEEFTYTFKTKGVYPYTCDLHPFMEGTIVVN